MNASEFKKLVNQHFSPNIRQLGWKGSGFTFYNDFANFPYPFDRIRPEDLSTKSNYKILDKYYTDNSIHFAWLLQEINLFIGRHDIAKEFSVLGLSQATENAERMLAISKSK